MLFHLWTASASIILGVVVSVLVNLLTSGFSWPLFSGLVTAVAAWCLVEFFRYLRSSATETEPGRGDTTATARGDASVAVAGDNHAPISTSATRSDPRK